MSEKFSRIISIVLYSLVGISTIIGIYYYAYGASSDFDGMESEIIYAGAPVTDLIMNWNYLLLVLATIIAIVFSVVGMVKNPKAAKSALIGIVALAIVFAVSYALGSDEMTDKYKGLISGPEASKRVSMGLIAFYILAIGAIVATIFSGVSKLFK